MYNVIWHIEALNKTHNDDCNITDISEIFAYCYNALIPNELRNILNNMKKGEKTTYNFPGTLDTMTITALEDTAIPF